MAPKRSDDYSRERRREIVAVARAEFARRGFGATSMNDLVSATGLSMGALYRYFPSKTDLILAVVEDRDGRTGGAFDDHEPVPDLIRRLAAIVGLRGADHARLVTHIWSSAAVDAEVASVTQVRQLALRDHLAGLMSAAGAAAGANPADRADVVLAALIGLAALNACGYPVRSDRFVEELIAMLDDPSSAT